MRTDMEDGVGGILFDLDEAPRKTREPLVSQGDPLASPPTYSSAMSKVVVGALLLALPTISQQVVEVEHGSTIEGVLIGTTLGFGVMGVVMFTRGLLLLKQAAESA